MLWIIVLGAFQGVSSAPGYECQNKTTITTDLADSWDMVFSPDGLSLLVAQRGAAKEVTKVDISSGAKTKVADGFSWPCGLALSADGLSLFVTDADNGEVVQVDLASGAKTTIVTGLNLPEGIMLTRDGLNLILATGGGDGDLLQVTIASGGQRKIATGIAYPGPPSYTIDGESIIVGQYYSAAYLLVNVESGAKRTITTLSKNPWGIAVATDGETFFVAHQSGDQLTQVDIASGAHTVLVKGVGEPKNAWPAGGPNGLVLAADGVSLYANHLGDSGHEITRFTCKFVAAAPTPATSPAPTPAPLPGPTPAPTPTPTPAPTPAPTLAPTAAPTPATSPAPTPASTLGEDVDSAFGGFGSQAMVVILLMIGEIVFLQDIATWGKGVQRQRAASSLREEMLQAEEMHNAVHPPDVVSTSLGISPCGKGELKSKVWDCRRVGPKSRVGYLH